MHVSRLTYLLGVLLAVAFLLYLFFKKPSRQEITLSRTKSLLRRQKALSIFAADLFVVFNAGIVKTIHYQKLG